MSAVQDITRDSTFFALFVNKMPLEARHILHQWRSFWINQMGKQAVCSIRQFRHIMATHLYLDCMENNVRRLTKEQILSEIASMLCTSTEQLIKTYLLVSIQDSSFMARVFNLNPVVLPVQNNIVAVQQPANNVHSNVAVQQQANNVLANSNVNNVQGIGRLQSNLVGLQNQVGLQTNIYPRQYHGIYAVPVQQQANQQAANSQIQRQDDDDDDDEEEEYMHQQRRYTSARNNSNTVTYHNQQQNQNNQEVQQELDEYDDEHHDHGDEYDSVDSYGCIIPRQKRYTQPKAPRKSAKKRSKRSFVRDSSPCV
jgi:hypothetical protein